MKKILFSFLSVYLYLYLHLYNTVHVRTFTVPIHVYLLILFPIFGLFLCMFCICIYSCNFSRPVLGMLKFFFRIRIRIGDS
jgi:hypothetical protein